MKEKTKRTKTNKSICSRNNNERVGAERIGTRPIPTMPAHNKGITLIALILTIIVLLILAVVAISAVKGDGIISHAKNARKETAIANEKDEIAVSFASAKIRTLGDEVTAVDLQEEMNNSLGLDKNGNTKVEINDNGDGTLTVLFKETNNNYNVDNGVATQEKIDTSTIAMFDTGENIHEKICALAINGDSANAYVNLSINAIKRYKGTPDLTKMTDANIVSWTEAYNLYEQNPSAYKDIIPEGISELAELCPIYMWFVEDGKEEMRNALAIVGTSSEKVKTGTIYWWCKSRNVYLNPDSSYMFAGLPYLMDISGLSGMRTDYVTNMRGLLCQSTCKLTNVNSLNKWNTSNVENMSALFYSLNGKLSNINGLKNWNTSNVTDMSGIFVGNSIENLDALKNWNTSNVTDMSDMFGNNDANGGNPIKNLDAISNWNVSKVTNMNSMFYGCALITDASAINSWNVVNVTSFDSMFFNCSTHPEFTKVIGTWDEKGTFYRQKN